MSTDGQYTEPKQRQERKNFGQWLGTYSKQQFHNKVITAVHSEQYLELMSAADAIITMRQHTQTIQTNICRLQAACNVDEIKSNISTKKSKQIYA